MLERHRIIIEMPLFDEAAQAIKETGGYRREITAKELSSIMSGVIVDLVQGQEVIKASVPVINVKIEEAKGIVNGNVKVEKPIQATINVNLILGNSTELNRIKLDELHIQQEADFAAKLALKTVNIEGKARETLKDPNQSLGLVLASQLEPRGVKLTEVGLHFNEQTLAVNLTGVLFSSSY